MEADLLCFGWGENRIHRPPLSEFEHHLEQVSGIKPQVKHQILEHAKEACAAAEARDLEEIHHCQKIRDLLKDTKEQAVLFEKIHCTDHLLWLQTWVEIPILYWIQLIKQDLQESIQGWTALQQQWPTDSNTHMALTMQVAIATFEHTGTIDDDSEGSIRSLLSWHLFRQHLHESHHEKAKYWLDEAIKYTPAESPMETWSALSLSEVVMMGLEGHYAEAQQKLRRLREDVLCCDAPDKNVLDSIETYNWEFDTLLSMKEANSSSQQLALLKQTQERLKVVESPKAVYGIHLLQGLILQRLSLDEEALDCYRKCLDLSQVHDELKVEHLKSVFNMGTFHSHLCFKRDLDEKQMQLASKCYQEALELFEAGTDTNLQVKAKIHSAFGFVLMAAEMKEFELLEKGSAAASVIKYWQAWEACWRQFETSVTLWASLLHGNATRISNNEDSYAPILKEEMTSILTLLLLQRLSFRKIHITDKHDAKTGGDTEVLQQKVLLWSERAYSRTLVYHLHPFRFSAQSSKLMLDFDLDDDLAWASIRLSQEVCGPGTVFVEYSHQHSSELAFSQINFYLCMVLPNGKVLTGFMELENLDWMDYSVKFLLQILSNPDEYTEEKDKVMEHLADLYDDLIRPIAPLLQNMGPDHKLVFVASGLLTLVPFSILLDRETGRYLFQDHTISLAPSLRVINICQQRLMALERRPLSGAAGVALGDPAYNVNRKGRGQILNKRLEGSAREVDSICSLFQASSTNQPEHRVVNLQGKQATKEALLKFAGQPTQEGTSQAFIHIAAHGDVDGNKYRRGVVILANPDVKRWPPRVSRHNERGGVGELEEDENRNEPTRGENLNIKSKPIDVEGASKYRSGSITKFLWNEPERQGHTSRTRSSDICSSSSDEQDGCFGEETVTGAESPEREITLEGRTSLSNKYSASMSTSDQDLLSSDDITSCGFEWCAYMVVLSSCHSARGFTSPEGVLNLPRSFMVAGVPCSVVSQWVVNDQANPELMTLFYTALIRGKDVASALRWAMLQMLDLQRDLFALAPYIVWGLPTVSLPPQMQNMLEHS